MLFFPVGDGGTEAILEEETEIAGMADQKKQVVKRVDEHRDHMRRFVPMSARRLEPVCYGSRPAC